jgi:adenosylcobinamide amidohydrolase
VPELPFGDAVLLHARLIEHSDGGALLWQAGPGWQMISSAVLGGGLGPRAWVLNAQVGHGYARMDPDRHLSAIAQEHGMTGRGVGLMTAARVAEGAFAADGGAEAVVTAGIGVHGWAAEPPPVPHPRTATAQRDSAPAGERPTTPNGHDGQSPALRPPAPGTINIVVALPVALSPGALVNAVTTATEAKVQALRDAGFDASGTPTDAVCVAARADGVEIPFAGPRSEWGSRLARAVHAATVEAVLRYRARRLR